MMKKIAVTAFLLVLVGRVSAEMTVEQQEKWKKFDEDMKGYAETMNKACGIEIKYDAKPEWFTKSFDKDIATMFWSVTEAVSNICNTGHKERIQKKLTKITFKPGEKTFYNVKAGNLDYTADLDQKENNAASTRDEIEKYLKSKL